MRLRFYGDNRLPEYDGLRPGVDAVSIGLTIVALAVVFSVIALLIQWAVRL